MNKFYSLQVGDLVSSDPIMARECFMPGVGIIKEIWKLDATPNLYVCECQGKFYIYRDSQIYLYEAY